MADFHLAIPTLLRHEGGYINDPDDCGGATNFGICQRSYPHLDISRLTLDDAKAIYERDFWKPLLLGQVHFQAVATKLLDTAVLIGKTRADVAEAGRAMEAMLNGEDIFPGGDWADLKILQPVKDYKARHNSILLPSEAVEKAFKGRK